MNNTTTHNDKTDAAKPLEEHELDSVSGGTEAQDAAQAKAEREWLTVSKQLIEGI